jgi:hypothetical protein
MACRVQIVNPIEDPAWDQAVVRHVGSGFFHMAAWPRVLRAAYGFDPCCLAGSDPDDVLALLPMVRVESRLTGRRGVSLPFADSCEPLCRSPAAFTEVFGAAIEMGRRRHWRYVELRGGRGLVPAGTPASARYLGHRLALSADEDAVFTRFHGPVRTAVRKAIREGVRGEVSQSIAAVREFSRLNGITRRRHGLPPQPDAFFRAVHEHVVRPGHGVISSATCRGQTIASAVFFRHAAEALYKYGASDPRFAGLRANDLAMWNGIRWAIGQGCTRLTMGRTCLDHAGLRQFKRGWGTEEYTIEYFRYDVRRGTFTTARDPVSGWYNRLFRVMPMCALRLCGKLLSPHVA